MSLDLSASAPSLAPTPTPAGRLAACVRTGSLTTRAFLASRMLVLLAGLAGSLGLQSHAFPGQLAGSRALGSVGSLLGASVDRFDSSYYLKIATSGYGRPGSGRIAFFPVYPELIRGLAVITGSPVIAGVLISLGSLVVALTLLRRLTEIEFGRSAADATTLLLCFAPLSFFFSAVYTESLFLALSVGTFYAARTDRWRLACGLAAAATLSRPTGILLAGPLLVLWRREHLSRRELIWLSLPPAVLLAWMGTLGLLGFGITAEFHIEQTQWHRLSMFPVETLAVSLLAMLRGIVYVAGGGSVYHPAITGPFRPYAQDVILGGVLILCLVLLEGCRRRMRPEYAVYAGLVLLMCLASPEQGEPLWCFDRFALTIFPLWMAAGAYLGRHRRLLAPVLLLSAAALVFYTMQFASWAFIA